MLMVKTKKVVDGMGRLCREVIALDGLPHDRMPEWNGEETLEI